ncbi:MAG: DUF1385 domain-containing protein [Clostridia bacterium]|nr:DUF1385 domain-containing protein [Clostridia bacterium]
MKICVWRYGLKKNNSSCNIKTSIGGQALIEGVMMRGPKKTAMAVRNPEGEIVLEQWENETKKKSKFFKLPIIRGVFNFIVSMKFGYKCLMRSAEIAGLEDESKDDENKKGSSFWTNFAMVAASVLGVVLALFLFIALPTLIYSGICMISENDVFSEENRYLKSAIEGVLKVVILVTYMALVSLMKDIRRTFMYHGAEHKTIFCYESGEELTVENVKKQKRFHPRCGTSFLILMVLVSILIGFFIPIGIPDWLRICIKLLLFPITMGIGYELIKFAGKHENIITKIISAPGVGLQHLTVFEPDDEMIECAIAAMKEVIPEDGSDKI